MTGPDNVDGADAAAVCGMPDHWAFQQYVTQADVDRDPFTIALFDIVAPDGDDCESSGDARHRVGQTLLQFASPGTVVAYLGQNRFGLLLHSADDVHQWLAPLTTAVRSALAGADEESELAGPLTPADNDHETKLVVGFARGLSRQVLLNAELALTMAHRKQVPLLEYRPHDRTVAVATRQRQAGREMSEAAGDDRLVVFETRVEPLGRPEPDRRWVRLEAGIRISPEDQPSVIGLAELTVRDRRMIEFWLARQLAAVIDRSPPGSRLSIPVSAEAQRARSFAQRLFPLIERDRIAPQRLVFEVEQSAFTQELSQQRPDGESSAGVEAAQRFARQAQAMQVAVAVTEFDGGWNSWKALREVPVTYVIPAAEIVQRAGDGDYAAIRALAVMAADAEDRGIELIMPGVTNQLSDRALHQIGFTYRERGGQQLTVYDRSQCSEVPTAPRDPTTQAKR